VEGYQKEYTIKAGRLNIHVIIITITNRQNTDKQNHTKDKKKKKGDKGEVRYPRFLCLRMTDFYCG